MRLGQGYYKLLDPRHKYSKCYCTDEEIEMAVNAAKRDDLLKEFAPRILGVRGVDGMCSYN